MRPLEIVGLMIVVVRHSQSTDDFLAVMSHLILLRQYRRSSELSNHVLGILIERLQPTFLAQHSALGNVRPERSAGHAIDSDLNEE